MAVTTERIINLFNPKIILLVGICGGIKDVKVGDVVFARKIYPYESLKETDSGQKARPEVRQFNPKSLDIALSVARQQEWVKRTSHKHVFFEVYDGAIASGDKLLTTNNTTFSDFLDTQYNDTLAIDMESAGFIEALARHESIKSLCIRGISNLVANYTESKNIANQYLASENVAAFVFELIYQLKITDLNHSNSKFTNNGLIKKEKKVTVIISTKSNTGPIIGHNTGNIEINIPKSKK